MSTEIPSSNETATTTSCCGSCSTDDAPQPVAATTENAMMISDYKVSGMTCAHCVGSVTQELSGLPGVTGVDVDLATGTVSIMSTVALGVDSVREAVEEAGYALATG